MILTWFASVSAAQIQVHSLAGGFDYATDQPWAGVELARHPHSQRGFVLAGRGVFGFGFADRRPLVISELLAMWVIPSREAIIRLGGGTRSVLAVTDYGTPRDLFRLGDDWRLGWIPGVLAVLEMEFGARAPITVGLAAGGSPTLALTACDVGDTLDTCESWLYGFIGGFFGRKRFRNGLVLELRAGPTSHFSVGWTPRRH